MNTFKKIVIAFALCFGFALGSQQQARAQFVVSDPGSLIQQIMSYLLSELQETDGSGISKLLSSAENYKEIMDKLDQVKNLVGPYANAIEDIEAIANVTKLMLQDFKTFDALRVALASSGNYGIIAASNMVGILNGFRGAWNYILEEGKKSGRQITMLTRSDPLDMVHSLAEYAQAFAEQYSILRLSTISRINTEISNFMSVRNEQADLAFLNRMYY